MRKDKNCTLRGYYTANRGNFLQLFWDNLAVLFSGFKNPKESLLHQYGVYVGKSVGHENSQSVVSAIMVDGSGWEEGECGTWCSLETRHSVTEEILIGVIARHRRTICERSERKEKERKCNI